MYLPAMGSPVFTLLDTLPAPKAPRAAKDHDDRKAGKDLSVADPADARDYIPEDEVALSDDLAATVVRKTMRRIAAGKVEPSIKEGLAAQTILDRRAEKAADRRFMLALSQALAGGGVQTPQTLLPPPAEGVIEGDFEEVNLAPAHLRSEP